jgi:sucrose phosphorylase
MKCGAARGQEEETPEARLYRELEQVYGQEALPRLRPAVEALLAQYRPAIPPPPRGDLPLTERDVLLITYADQVQAPPAPPLAALGDFLRQRARDWLSGVHLLPFYPSSSDDGFSVVDYLAVDPAVGTWDDVARLGADGDLMLDAVINHASVQSDWFQRFLRDEAPYRDYFITVDGAPDLSAVVRPRALPLLTEFQTAAGPKRVWTTFSADQVDLNYRTAAVFVEVLRVLLEYCRRGARFLRLDAIAFLWKEVGTGCVHLPQTHALIRALRAALDAVYPQSLFITETNVPHRDNVSYFGDGWHEAQLVYNFALPPLTLHALLRGDASILREWAAALEYPSPGVTFFNFLASHDGIGLNPARGILPPTEVDFLVEHVAQGPGLISYKANPDGSRSPYELNVNYLDALQWPGEPEEAALQKFLTAHALLLALRGMPGIYFHSLFGSRGDPAGAAASGIPRRINRQKLRRAELEAELSRPESLRARIFAGMSRMLRCRRAQPAFSPHAAQTVHGGDSRLLVIERQPAQGPPVWCLHNVSGAGVRFDLPVRTMSAVRDLLSGELFHEPDIPLAPWQSRWVQQT